MPGSSEPAGPARVVFLGGVGEVGRNMACVELDGRILIVDVGLSFPHAEMPGIDLVLPDFEYVRERFDDVEAIVLTHGHHGPHRRAPVPAARVRGRPDARLRDGVHARAARGAAGGAPGPRPRRVPAGHARRGRGRRAVLDAVPPRHALDPGRDGGRDRHAVRLDPAYGRLQDRPDAAGRARHRPARARRGGGPGRPPAAERLDQRRGVRVHGQRAERRPGPAGHHRARAAAGRGRVLLEPHPPDPAGRERRPLGRARGRVPRPLDAPERGGGAAARDPARARGRRDPDRGGRAPRSRLGWSSSARARRASRSRPSA